MTIQDVENVMVKRIKAAAKSGPLSWSQAMAAADRGYDSYTATNRDRIAKFIKEGRLTLTELPNGDSVIT